MRLLTLRPFFIKDVCKKGVAQGRQHLSKPMLYSSARDLFRQERRDKVVPTRYANKDAQRHPRDLFWQASRAKLTFQDLLKEASRPFAARTCEKNLIAKTSTKPIQMKSRDLFRTGRHVISTPLT